MAWKQVKKNKWEQDGKKSIGFTVDLKTFKRLEKKKPNNMSMSEYMRNIVTKHLNFNLS